MGVIFPAKMMVPAHKLAGGIVKFLKEFDGDTLPEGVIGLTDDMKVMFRGDVLFELKSTHGLPIEMVLDRIINECGMAVDWVAFIEAARRNGWWDFQTYDVIRYGMEDAGLPREMQSAIIERFQLYVLAYPHPMMKVSNAKLCRF